MKRSRKGMRRRSQRGFTLVEILLVAAILVVLASMATLGYTAMQRSATARLARSEIKTLESACDAFKVMHMQFPAQLEDLMTPPQGMSKSQWGGPFIKSPNFTLNDPWKLPYRYTRDEAQDTVLISSAGPDQQWNTEDDIRNIGQ